MTNTATRKIYHIQEDFKVDEIETVLTGKEYEYKRLEFDENLQTTQVVEIRVFGKANHFPPDWKDFIGVYLHDNTFFNGSKKFDLLVLVKCKSKDEKDHIFAICFGAAYFHIENMLDHDFGISILETIFDPRINRINSIADKSITGDILSSTRHYRKPRSVVYEDDFGKYYQEISSSITEEQLRRYFPYFVGYHTKKVRPLISINGSSSIELKMMVSFVGVIRFVKDLADLMSSKRTHVFIRSLVPVDKKTQHELVNRLDGMVYEKLIEFYYDPKIKSIDFVFCHHNVEQFFGSSLCQLNIPGITDMKGNKIEGITTEDVYTLSESDFLFRLLKKIEESVEIKKSLNKKESLKHILSTNQVSTQNEEGYTTTHGDFIEYIQMEIEHDHKLYFLLDRQWFLLQADFDKSINEKYKTRVSTHFQNHTFVKKWEAGDETFYNSSYNNPPISLYLHLIKVNFIELCDALVLDMENKVIYLLHVKNKLGASIRDLTSQVAIASDIIEEEIQTNKTDSMQLLYDQAIVNKRLAIHDISKEDFLKWTSTFRREYVLVVHDTNKSPEDIRNGNYESRIAKYALVQFATKMYGNDCNFSICCA